MMTSTTRWVNTQKENGGPMQCNENIKLIWSTYSARRKHKEKLQWKSSLAIGSGSCLCYNLVHCTWRLAGCRSQLIVQQQSVGTHIRFDYISCHNTNLIKCLIEFRFDGEMHERKRCACDGRQERLIFSSDHTQTHNSNHCHIVWSC